jgi:excisionase family DNA binding protein
VQDAVQDERLTVADAAERLGISKEAVRKRISRGTLRADKAPDGMVRVYIPATETPSSTAVASDLVEELRDRLRYVEGQLEAERAAHAESRRLLLAALERIPPQLEAPSQEPSESPESPAPSETPAPAGGGAQEAVTRRWWEFWR